MKADSGFISPGENPIEVEVGIWLRRRGLWLATAESCTGGLVGHLITNVPGSSEIYAGGVIAYANEVKMNLLGVPAGLLGMYGAVSRETALEMARGVRYTVAGGLDPKRLVGLAVTGIAGPGGGSADKPVGLTWIGINAVDFSDAWRFEWNGDRVMNKQFSAIKALQLVADYLHGLSQEGD